MSKWSQIYKNQIDESTSIDVFIKNRLAYKQKLIDIIEKYGNSGKRLLEVGCGSGITTTFLAKNGYQVIGIDSDPDMIKLAKSISKQQKSNAYFAIDDIKTLTTTTEHFTVIFSNGVMEHFSNEDIILIINRHLSVCDYLIISIPSDYFSNDQKMFGDERFMDVETWRSIIQKTRGKIIEEFNFNSNQPTNDKPQFIGFVLTSL